MLTNDDKRIVSPSRTYVAMCNKSNWDGHYFKKFTLPENTDANRIRIWGDGVLTHPDGPKYQIRNDAEFASWFFLNELNHCACIEGCLAAEDFSDVKDETPWYKADILVEDLNPVFAVEQEA